MGLYDGIYLFADMDGTLFDDNKHIPQANVDALIRFTAEGGGFGLATGRSPYNFGREAGRLPLNIPSIMHNGGILYDTHKRQYTSCAFIDRGRAIHLVNNAVAHRPDISVNIYTRRFIYQINPNPNRWYDPVIVQESIVEQLCPIEEIDEGWLDIVISYPEEKMQAFLKDIDYLQYDKDFSIVHSGPIYYEFLPPGTNKGTALRRFRDMNRDKIKKILAIGDYFNDLEMLKCADAACAPQNAEDEIKAICKYQSVHCNEGTVADFLEQAVFSGKEL